MDGLLLWMQPHLHGLLTQPNPQEQPQRQQWRQDRQHQPQPTLRVPLQPQLVQQVLGYLMTAQAYLHQRKRC